MPAWISLEPDPSYQASPGRRLSPVRSRGQPHQPLLHPRHSGHHRRRPTALAPRAALARGHSPGCHGEALAHERPCVNGFRRSRDRAIADEQSHRRRIGRGLEGIDIEALPSATAARARHFANDTPRAAAQGPHRTLTPEMPTAMPMGNAESATSDPWFGPIKRPRATALQALHRRWSKATRAEAGAMDRSRPRWPRRFVRGA